MFNDWFSIGPFTVHGYGFFIAVGVLTGLWLACHRAKKKGLNDDICFGLVLVAVFFGVIGAKLLYMIVEWRDLIKDPISVIASSGFVVVGGLTVGMIAIFVYCRIKKVDGLTYFEHCLPSVPLGQAFGRIGCFMAGCCYGKETTCPIGITFTNSHFAPNHVKLLPTQLFSAGANFLHVIVLLLIARKVKKKGVLTGCYFIFYSIGRFIIELFRDDPRGSVGALSTSQFYGIFMLAFGIFMVVWGLKHKEKTQDEAIQERG